MHANINSLWYSEFLYEMHSHLDFLERLLLPSSGFTLVEVAVRSKTKAKEMEGECFAFIGKMIQYGFVVH